MKKKIAGIIAATMGLIGLLGCSTPNTPPANTAKADSIVVISREDGSGTRGAFIELFGVEEKDADGNQVDHTTEDADITNSTSVMMQSVAGNRNAIGYISLGSLNATVKAARIDGVEASVDNIKAGLYQIARPFNIATKATVSDATTAFISFIVSAQGQAVIETNGYISAMENITPFAGSTVSGKVVVAGSSSVTPVMEKLKEAYQLVNPNAEIEIQQSDSSTGMNMAIDGSCDIGMASRALKDSELEKGIAPTVIAMDGIAVIVNNASTVNELTSDQVRRIFTGDIVKWNELLG
ncbi:MAG: substrate-binding domain-containing protein [Clostridia bacterium]